MFWHRHHNIRVLILMAFDQSKTTYLPLVGTATDGTVALVSPADFTLSASEGSVSVFTVTEETPIPGTNLVLEVGAQVYTYPAPNTTENIVFTAANVPNGIDVAPLTISYAVATPTPAPLASATFAAFQV